MYDLAVTGGTLVMPDGERRGDVAVAGGRIAAIVSPDTPPTAQRVIDARGLHVLPGAIDIHCHVRAPAFPERGTVASETAAAAKGGITTLFEMPITKPCCNSPAEVARRRACFAETAFIDFGLYAAPGELTTAAFDALVAEGVIGLKMFTTTAPPGRMDEFAGLVRPDEAEQLRVLELAAAAGLPVVVHAESAELLAAADAEARALLDPADAATHGKARPPLAEALAVAKLLTLNTRANAWLHIAHVTSAATVDVLRRFQGSSDFSAETCPQYLCCTEADVARVGVFGKVNPPIRGESDRAALWQAVGDGLIQHVTTDHAGFTAEEKAAHAGDFLAAPPGHPGTEVLLPVLLDAAVEGRITLARVADLVAGNAARRFRLAEKGRISPGAQADLTLVDLAGETLVTQDSLLTAARATAHLYHGKRFRGRVRATLVAGRTVWREDAVVGQPGEGRYVQPAELTDAA